jgi:hypothetical protein
VWAGWRGAIINLMASAERLGDANREDMLSSLAAMAAGRTRRQDQKQRKQPGGWETASRMAVFTLPNNLNSGYETLGI